MSYFNYKGQNIYYNQVGDGKTILLLHGNTASSYIFEHGGHPALISNADEIIKICDEFFIN